MKKQTMISWLVLLLVTMTLSGCIWPFWWDDGGRGGGHGGGDYREGGHHEGGHHEGGDRR